MLAPLILMAAPLLAPTAAPMPLPRVSEITIDGDAADWPEQGLAVDILTPPRHSLIAPDDFDATLRLGWDDTGVFALVTVHDDINSEDNQIQSLWTRDSVEFFLSTGLGSSERYQFVVAPGLSEDQPELRFYPYDKRVTDQGQPLSAEFARLPIEGGYIMEAYFPWSNLGIQPEADMPLAFQLIVNDADEGNARVRLTWFPSGETSQNKSDMQALILSEESGGSSVRFAATPREREVILTEMEVVSTPDSLGQTLTLQRDGQDLGSGIVQTVSGRAVARIAYDPETPPGPVAITMDGKVVGQCAIPTPGKAETTLSRNNFVFDPCLLSSNAFPRGAFADPVLAAHVLGEYTVETQFFNAAMEPVKSPETTGRYGAVSTITAADGSQLKRYNTLYRMSDDDNWVRERFRASVDFPPSFGLDPAVTEQQQTILGDWFKYSMDDSMTRNDDAAVLVAGLAEFTPDGPYSGPWEKNMQWWKKLKRGIGDEPLYLYLVFLPEGYDADPDKQWPLIFFLHGAGERGDDVNAMVQRGLVTRMKKENAPYIVVTPQCPTNEWWDPDSLMLILDEVEADYRIDPERITITGLSMGGFGSWQLGQCYPEHFAAIAPICGGGHPEAAARYVDLPVWAFHGTADSVVVPEASIEMVEAVNAAGGNAKLTLYPDTGHDSWTQAYNEPELYEWLLSQKRAGSE